MSLKLSLWRFIIVTVFAISITVNNKVKAEEPVGHEIRYCDCKCGLRNPRSRIIGGFAPKAHEFPWQVRIMSEALFTCGGTLINDRFVLTAAHCLVYPVNKLTVVVGDHDMCEEDDGNRQLRFVTSAFEYNYDNKTFKNDIALLELNEPVTLSNVVSPICLPKDEGKTYVGETATVIGWGNTSEDDMPPCVLQAAEVSVKRLEECKTAYQNKIEVSDKALCAASEGKDACRGDSGGPLVRMNGHQYEVIGVVSLGIGCGRKEYPGVYTKVTEYLDWIEATSSKGCFCK